tara:strand:- start:31852 stop:32706 length:855 start_codon:yes stop_codon:yes gene_type:complete
MTGFGSTSRTVQGVVVSAEVRALNSRFLDLRFRLPKQLESMEEQMNKKVRESCDRGRITVTFAIEPSNGSSKGALEFDRQIFESYKDLTDKINKDYGCHIPVTDVLDIRKLLTVHEPLELEEASVLEVFDEALSQLHEMRSSEGEVMAADIEKRVTRMESLLKEVGDTTAANAEKFRQEFREKIASMLEGTDVDESRIAMEAAVLSEKADVTEECVRCTSHLEQIDKLVTGDDPAGKRLNFLLQEVVREINTIGSKTADLNIINRVVDLKEESEKIKEQVQNIL